MYEKIAWQTFCKSGNIQSFLEYKNLCDVLNLGEKCSETDKSEGDNNKGNSIQR